MHWKPSATKTRKWLAGMPNNVPRYVGQARLQTKGPLRALNESPTSTLRACWGGLGHRNPATSRLDVQQCALLRGASPFTNRRSTSCPECGPNMHPQITLKSPSTQNKKLEISWSAMLDRSPRCWGPSVTKTLKHPVWMPNNVPCYVGQAHLTILQHPPHWQYPQILRSRKTAKICDVCWWGMLDRSPDHWGPSAPQTRKWPVGMASNAPC
jgi:hypothetical protein